MAEKVTIMKLKVDLQCDKCYKKVKKVLCKFPQIRDQVYDEKQNIVTITVVCCSPEKIRDKLCCKGGGSIKSIEIVEPPKPKPPEPEKKKPEEKKEPEKPKAEPEKKKEPEKPPEKPKAEPEKKKEPGKPKAEPEKKTEPEKPKESPKKEPEKPKEKPAKPVEPPPPGPVCPPAPPPVAVRIGVCCVPCYEGHPGGPCFHGYGGPPQCYGGYYARPVYDSYCGGRPYYVSRCDQYFSDENPRACTIM